MTLGWRPSAITPLPARNNFRREIVRIIWTPHFFKLFLARNCLINARGFRSREELL